MAARAYVVSVARILCDEIEENAADNKMERDKLESVPSASLTLTFSAYYGNLRAASLGI